MSFVLDIFATVDDAMVKKARELTQQLTEADIDVDLMIAKYDELRRLKHRQIQPLAPSAIGYELEEMMKKTVERPINLVHGGQKTED